MFIALLDFLFIACGVYSGYALRLGILIPAYVADCFTVMLVMPCVCVAVFAAFGQYRTIWQHAGTEDYNKFLWLYIAAVSLFLLVNGIFKLAVVPRVSFAVAFFAGLFLCGGLRASWLMAKSLHKKPKGKKAIIYGAGEAGAFLARDLMRNETEMFPAGFVDDDTAKQGRYVSGLKVLGGAEDLRAGSADSHS